MENIKYSNNLLENCVYSIEYFLEKNQNDTESYMNNIEICENIFRFGGYGWGQQRHNTHTPALIKGWSYENTAYNYCIHHNIYDRCAYRLVHLICKEKECLPIMHDNTYIQKYGLTLGQYGENKLSEPPILAFFDNAEDIITNSWNDKNSKVYYIK